MIWNNIVVLHMRGLRSRSSFEPGIFEECLRAMSISVLSISLSNAAPACTHERKLSTKQTRIQIVAERKFSAKTLLQRKQRTFGFETAAPRSVICRTGKN